MRDQEGIRSRRLRTDEDIVIKELLPKQGRPLFLGTALDSVAQQYMWRGDAKGIVNVMDKTRLVDHYTVSTMGKVIVKRMDFAK